MEALQQQRRFIRQTQLADIGEAGQEILRTSRVLVVGAGGLGSPVLTYLACAGVGQLGIIDDDRVELSNLNRQILHETADIGRFKVDSARDRLEELYPDISITTYREALTADNAHDIIKSYDVIADGSDNFATRFAVNAACIALKKPLVSAALSGFEGQISTFAPHLVSDSPCYACFVSPDAPEANTCRDVGAIGAVCGIVGSMQALEIIHTLLGRAQLIGTLLCYDGRSFTQRRVALPKDPHCPVCS